MIPPGRYGVRIVTSGLRLPSGTPSRAARHIITVVSQNFTITTVTAETTDPADSLLDGCTLSGLHSQPLIA
jgi:hypothetical protein